MKAHDLGPVNEGIARGDQRLYRLEPPLKCSGDAAHEYVVVSAVNAFSSPETAALGSLFGSFAGSYYGPGEETFIFPSNAHGTITDWGELEGSYKGGLDHAEALAGAGYTIVQEAPNE